MTRWQSAAVLLAVAVTAAALAGCARRGVGESCRRTGDSFVSRDPCETMCLAFPIGCPDGTSVTPNVCAGRQACLHGQCPTGQVCFRVNVDRSFCVPDTICPTWRTHGVAEPVLIPDEEVHRRLFGRPAPVKPVD